LSWENTEIRAELEERAKVEIEKAAALQKVMGSYWTVKDWLGAHVEHAGLLDRAACRLVEHVQRGTGADVDYPRANHFLEDELGLIGVWENDSSGVRRFKPR